ncbi:hypothetical protein [Aquabacterium sp. J223]|uniref:hypothetical protein n=1 Tax=Aquabacterium sp. J223 TaxID=2898431 RepID=UPI0021AE2DF2|nr:hypothetical protein [Aquabacterium sp. J223]UUX93957.1 hypothetical protein LRS07_11345 [Aquabacterium sp. J223]
MAAVGVAAWTALAACIATPASAQTWQLELHSDRHSDALPLADLADEDHRRLRPRDGRNLAYLDEEVRLARSSGAWTFGLLARSRATLVLNRDAVELLAQVNKAAPADVDRQWQVDARLRGFAGVGADAERRFALGPSWTLRLGAQGLLLTRWRERRIDGPVGYTAATRGYAFDLRSVETYDRLDAPFLQGFEAHGMGLLLNGEVAWADRGWDAALAVRDLGWLHWRGIPQQSASLSTSTQSYDADGFLLYRPLVQGRNSQTGHTAAAPQRWTARLGWAVQPAHRLELATDWLTDFGLLPRLTWEHRAGDRFSAIGWRFHERRLGVGVGWRGWRLHAATDRLGSGAHSRSLTLAWHGGF